jgi:hypothetical protein
MSRTTSAADGGRVAAELRNWARGCHSTEAALELLIRARGGRFVDPSQPWLHTDDRGIVWLDAQVIRQYSHAVSSGERNILALVEALALGGPFEDVAVSWPAWTPTISVSFLRSCGMPALAASRHAIPQFLNQRDRPLLRKGRANRAGTDGCHAYRNRQSERRGATRSIDR